MTRPFFSALRREGEDVATVEAPTIGAALDAARVAHPQRRVALAETERGTRKWFVLLAQVAPAPRMTYREWERLRDYREQREAW